MLNVLQKKSILAWVTCFSMLICLVAGAMNVTIVKADTQPVTAQEMVHLMGRGINLGNTFEGNWNNPKDYDSVKKIVDAYIDAGYTNIRIPVSWGGSKLGAAIKSNEEGIINFNDEQVVTIKKIVDYVLLDINEQRKSQGKSEIILIIDAHHENWAMTDVIGSAQFEKNMQKLENIWKSICTLFKDAPATLVFEFLNEPQDKLNTGDAAKASVIEINNRIYNIIRNYMADGQKIHRYRNLVFGGHQYNSSFGLRDAYKIIEDIPGKGQDKYIMATYHSYFSKVEDNLERIDLVFADIAEKFNIPVYIGEFGFKHQGNITNETIDFYRQIADYAIKNKFAFSVWDDNGWFQIYKRTSGTFNALNGAVLGNGSAATTQSTNNVTDNNTDSNADTNLAASGNHNGIAVSIDGKTHQFNPAPMVINDRTLVPMRAIFEVLGADVEWDDATGTVSALKNDTEIILKIGEGKAQINDRVINLDVPAQLLENRTMVPLRFVSEALGCDVKWDELSQIVTITGKTGSVSANTGTVSADIEDPAAEAKLSALPKGTVVAAQDAFLKGTLKGSDFGEIKKVLITDYPFYQALQINTKKKTQYDYNMQIMVPTKVAVKKGDIMLATFYARTLSSTDSAGFGKMGFVLEQSIDPYAKATKLQLNVSKGWKKYYVPFAAGENITEGKGQLCVRAGFDPQVIEIGGMELTNYGNTVTLDQLPKN